MKIAILSLLLIVATANAQIDILDFLSGNVLQPFLTDITTGSLNALNSLLASLIGSIGKRELSLLPIAQSIIQNILDQFKQQIGQIFQTLVSTMFQSLGNLNSLFGPGKSVARVSGLKAVALAKFDLTNAVQDLINQLTTQLQSIGINLSNTVIASILNGLNGKRDISSFLDILTGHANNIYTSIVQVGSQLVGVNI